MSRQWMKKLSPSKTLAGSDLGQDTTSSKHLDDQELYEGGFLQGLRHGQGVVYYPRNDPRNRQVFSGSEAFPYKMI